MCHHVQNKRLESQRVLILRALVSRRHPWIDHTEELLAVLQSLATSAHQNLFDLERLFHSCRFNPEVTKETINLFQVRSLPCVLSGLGWGWGMIPGVWHKTATEVGRLNVLHVVERILNNAGDSFAHGCSDIRAVSSTSLVFVLFSLAHPHPPTPIARPPPVLTPGDANFEKLTSWMHGIEERLDPYKSPQALKMLLSLRKRAEEMRRQYVSPISVGQYQEKVDLFFQYRKIRRVLADGDGIAEVPGPNDGMELRPLVPHPQDLDADIAVAVPLSPDGGGSGLFSGEASPPQPTNHDRDSGDLVLPMVRRDSTRLAPPPAPFQTAAPEPKARDTHSQIEQRVRSGRRSRLGDWSREVTRPTEPPDTFIA
ncbi:hypothetical protein PAPYR_8475 [Paratrimastix pyriformis]|uniref:Uncharacterized protein n=1 Tax=Paratrimastix pyriformis TaxID=342808 RepID=A0ABQ8UC44_9EUKA|nr:hypothetical protein PAPYR_8475 [Paratrimastix pyriformis]